MAGEQGKKTPEISFNNICVDNQDKMSNIEYLKRKTRDTMLHSQLNNMD